MQTLWKYWIYNILVPFKSLQNKWAVGNISRLKKFLFVVSVKEKPREDNRFYLASKLNFYIDAFMYSSILLNQSINSCIMLPISFPPCLAIQWQAILHSSSILKKISCISIRAKTDVTSPPVNHYWGWLFQMEKTFRLLRSLSLSLPAS